MKKIATLLVFLSCLFVVFAEERPNILFITVDDMNCDSVGAFGSKVKDITPHIDQLATRGMKVMHAHTVIGNCKPSRNTMWSGLFPHHTGVTGFQSIKNPSYPHMNDIVKQHGYYSAIRGKVTHSTPYHPYPWDDDLTIAPDGNQYGIKDIESYYQCLIHGIKNAEKSNKPFCIQINISDPHKPFYGGKGTPNDPHPSKVYTVDEVPVPAYLPNDPKIHEEVAIYYSTVRRADDCVGQILKALKESGKESNTIIFFLSDHGMPLPFSKTQVYHHSTRTPLIAVWPGVIKENSVDQKHMVSTVDLMSTALEMIGINAPKRQDGSSFYPILKGQAQTGRDKVFKYYRENAGANCSPMRSIETKNFCYIFNPWSNGERIMKTATMGTVSYKQMKVLAESDSNVKTRLDLFEHRVKEELYDVSKDPDCLNNLVDHPEYQNELKKLRKELETWMVQVEDDALEVFRNRNNQSFLDNYIDRLQAESDANRPQKQKKKKNSKKKK
jgi:N-sulfoglucosamine sulfohydrolase